jgi:glycosyltransferase involved in cell wall biosynthesis
MRVLLTATAAVDQRLDGVTVFTNSLAGHLAASGLAEVALLVSDLSRGPAQEELAEVQVEGRKVFRLALREPATPEEAVDNGRCEELFSRILEAYRPDVVHFGNLELLSAGMVEVAQGAGIPTLMTLHDFYLICPAVRLMGLGSTELCPGPELGGRCGRCLAATGHLSGRYRGPWRWLQRYWDVKLCGRWKRAYRARFERFQEVIPRFDALVCPSQFMGEIMKRNQMLSNYQVIPNGSELSLLPPRANRAQIVFGMLAHHTRAKGTALALEAMKRLPGRGIHLEIHGDGDPRYLTPLRMRAQGDPRISFEGPYGPGDRERILKGLDVLIVPSLFPENGPLVVQDALATGRPCVVPAATGAAEAVRGMVHGLHFRRGDVDSLATALSRIAADPGMIARMHAAIRDDRPILPRADVANRYLEAYHRVLGAN